MGKKRRRKRNYAILKNGKVIKTFVKKVSALKYGQTQANKFAKNKKIKIQIGKIK